MHTDGQGDFNTKMHEREHAKGHEGRTLTGYNIQLWCLTKVGFINYFSKYRSSQGRNYRLITNY